MANQAGEIIRHPSGKQETKEEAAYREAPHNVQAEQAILGALLTNNDAVNRIGDFLIAEHFYEPAHRAIYEAILKLQDKGLVATPITLKHHFDHSEVLSGVGGAEYLARLAGMAVGIINLESHARVVYDLALRRALIHLGEDVVNEAFDRGIETSAREQIEEAEQRLFTLASEGHGEKGFLALKTSLTDAMERVNAAYKSSESISGTSVQFSDLDRILGGLQPSDLLILAGRPSMGKTALAVNLAVNACQTLKNNHDPNSDEPAPAVGFFSLEMSSEQLAARMIAMESAVNSSKMRVGNLTDQEFAKLVEANKRLYELPFFIDDTPALSIAALRTRARRLKRRHNLGVLFIDYLQLVRGSKANQENRVQEVSEITQGLKAIAKELNIPVIALSQLSRAVEQRTDKHPQLSDLRESGSIEQDADVVMFIYREEYYLEREQPREGTPEHITWQEKMERCRNITEVIIAKQRNGPIGNVHLYFDANTTKFKDYQPDTHLPAAFHA